MKPYTSFLTNKKTATLFLVMSLVFSASCFIVTMAWVAYIQTFVSVWEFQLLAAIVCTGVFIASLVTYWKKLKPREAIVISDEGVNDTINELSFGIIKWSDIKEVTTINSLVLISVNNTEEYISRAKNPGMKRLLGSYLKKYGTPVVLNASYLQCTSEELASAIRVNRK